MDIHHYTILLDRQKEQHPLKASKKKGYYSQTLLSAFSWKKLLFHIPGWKQVPVNLHPMLLLTNLILKYCGLNFLKCLPVIFFIFKLIIRGHFPCHIGTKSLVYGILIHIHKILAIFNHGATNG